MAVHRSALRRHPSFPSIIPHCLEMTRICLPIPTQNINDFFQDLVSLSTECAHLCMEGSTVAMVDIHFLGDLLSNQSGLTFFSSLLSPEELIIFSKFKYQKRRQEWLAGRLAAKYCLANHLQLLHLTPDSFTNHSIVPDSTGAPKLLPTPYKHPTPPMLSISHSHKYGVAMACPNSRCGIDIQKKSQKLEKVREKFVSREELKIPLKGVDDITRLTMIWVAKEAVKKSMLHDQPTLFSGIQFIEASMGRNEPWQASCSVAPKYDQRITVRIMEWKDYLIGCTTGVSSA